MKSQKFKFAFVLISVLAVLFTGCASSTGTPAGTSSASSAATSSNAPAGTSSIDLSGVTLRVQSFGTTEKLLKEAGLSDTPYKIEFLSYTGSQLALQAMAADQLDLARSSEMPPLFASLTQGGGNFKIVATYEGNTLNQALIVGPKSTIQSVAELKGKKVGYIKATTSQYFLLKMLKNAGLEWKDIEPVNLTPSDGLAALLSGDIQAFAVFGNQITANNEKGGRVLQSAKDILSGNYLYEASDIALADPAKSAAIVDYLQRLEKSEEWIRNNYEKYAAFAADSFGMTSEKYVAYLKEGDAQRKGHVRVTSEKDLTFLQDVADSLNQVGVLEKKVDVNTIYSKALENQIKTAISSK